MPRCIDEVVEFGRVGRRVVEAAFDGGDIVSDGGVLLLKRVIKRLLVPLRRAWPKAKIIVRADSGFCRPRVLQRVERWGMGYVIGLQKNSLLAQQVELAKLALAEQYAASKTKRRMFGQFEYAAGVLARRRRRYRVAAGSRLFCAALARRRRRVDELPTARGRAAGGQAVRGSEVSRAAPAASSRSISSAA